MSYQADSGSSSSGAFSEYLPR